jgi:uncharacterized protein (DUF1786 family)
MQVLTVDIGTGTQDIYLFRSGLSMENGFKLVLPSPTLIVRSRIQEATRQGATLLLTGVTMGGGPAAWAAMDHLKAGHSLFATPEAARTFNDDLVWVREEMGVDIVSEDEASKLDGVEHIEMRDFDYDVIAATFAAYNVRLDPKAVAVAVFDHGAAPPDISDRRFRFDYLKDRIQTENRLSAFAYLSENVPPIMTRMQAVVKTAGKLDCPLVLMDTAPAAVIGATLDPNVAARPRVMIVNVGNFHTLAFRLGQTGIEGVFEHHTGELDRPRLEGYLRSFADGSLTNQEVFDDQGHGAIIFDTQPLSIMENDFGVIVTGPRRAMLEGSHLRPYFAVPYGDMMLTGCYGLLSVSAELVPSLADPILAGLTGEGAITTPWDEPG